jgi:hypothetical protein
MRSAVCSNNTDVWTIAAGLRALLSSADAISVFPAPVPATSNGRFFPSDHACSIAETAADW